MMSADCDPLVNGVVAAVVGAISAFLFNVIHWYLTRKKDLMERHSNALVNKIESFGQVSVRYWSASNEGAGDLYALDTVTRNAIETEMTVTFLALNKHVRAFINDHFSTNAKYSQEQEFYAELQKLFDLATGGEFQTNNRSRDRARASKIASLCSDLSIRLQRSVSNK